MSECTGPQTCSLPGPQQFFVGSCGVSLPGTELRIMSPDEHGNGEICYRGRNVFMGYLKNDEATRATIDSEGFLHSGDIGQVSH